MKKREKRDREETTTKMSMALDELSKKKEGNAVVCVVLMLFWSLMAACLVLMSNLMSP